MSTLFAPTVNLVILVGVLFYYLRSPLSNFVSSRHVSIREELAAVEKQLLEAKAKYQEFSNRLNSLESEAQELRARAIQDAQAMKTRLLEEAHRLSADIVKDSKASAEHLYSELRGQLYADLSHHVLERAEKLLRDRLTGDDRARIQKEFSHQLETTQ